MVPDAQRRQNRALSFQESPLRPRLRGRSLIRCRYRKLDPNILMMQFFEERHGTQSGSKNPGSKKLG